jgi:phosphoserine phosphatase RsbU/P
LEDGEKGKTMLPADKLENILIVDDNPANLRLLSEILTGRGFKLRAVTGGQRALTSVDLYPPDLILLDIRMPDMDGYTTCQHLKANPKWQDIPVIFISALDEIQDKMKAFSVGAVDYVTKPFQMEEVIARVETHLSLRRLQKNLQEANQRMEHELKLAARVQTSFMPQKKTMSLPGWQLATALVPAKMTSGDFYDIIRLPDGTVGFIIADVVDKGVGAALFMAMSCALLRTNTVEHPSQPQKIFEVVNQHLLDYTTLDQFVTVFLGWFDPNNGKLVYSNAGHNPPILLNGFEQPIINLLSNTGPPLGVMLEARWEQKTVYLHQDDVLVLYTDGITEAENSNRDFYGMERLVDIIYQHSKEPAEGIKDEILKSVYEFTFDSNLSDDIALMILSCA